MYKDDKGNLFIIQNKALASSYTSFDSFTKENDFNYLIIQCEACIHV